MANLASGLTPIEKNVWANAPEATNGNITVYDGQTGFASAKYPNNFTLDLEKSHPVVAIRFLLWDGLGQPGTSRDVRQYFYRLFTSEDNKKWEFIWGTGRQGFNGWQVFEFQRPQKARFVRLECLNNTGNTAFHIVEFEVHDKQPDQLPTDRVTLSRYISDSLQPLRNKVNELISEIEAKSKEISVINGAASAWSYDIEEVHNRLKGHEKDLDDILATFSQASQQLEAIRADHATVSSNAEQSKTFLASIGEAQGAVNTLKTDIERERSEVVGLVDTIRGFHQSIFTPLQTEINQLQATASAHATNAGQAAGQAEDFKNQGNQALQGIQQALQQSQERFGLLEKIAEDVQKVFEKATNPVDGVQAKLDSINGIKGQIDAIAGEIRTTQELASKHAGEISKSKDTFDQILLDTTKLKDDIATEHSESVRLKGDIANILEIVSNTGRANSWDKRRKRAHYSAWGWMACVFIGVFISYYLVNKVFLSAGTDLFKDIGNGYLAFLLRVTLTAPGIFITWFSAAQYSKERMFLEQYEFKTASALAMESYTELLQRNYPERQHQTYELTVELIRMVYKEPVYSKPDGGIWGRFRMPFGVGDADIKVASNSDSPNP